MWFDAARRTGPTWRPLFRESTAVQRKRTEKITGISLLTKFP